MFHHVWSPDEVRALGVHTDVPTAGRVIGIGRSAAYALVRSGEFPVPVLRLGRRFIVPVQPLLALLGVDGADTTVPEPAERSPDRSGAPEHRPHPQHKED